MIIYTNRHPTKCANDLPKQSWAGMIKEYKSILSVVHKLVDNTDIKGISACSVNSPDVLWTRNSNQHYAWLFDCLCQLLVLDRKNTYTKEKDKEQQKGDDSNIILSLLHAPYNLLNHGWADPYSPDQKPYRKAAIDTHKNHLVGLWNSNESTPVWPQGQPEWIQWNEEFRKFEIKQEGDKI